MSEQIAVLGAGSWGIAVANLLHANGHKIKLWEFNKADCEYLIEKRTLEKKLPGIDIPREIDITNNLEEAIHNAADIVMAIPAQRVRSVCDGLNKIGLSKAGIINLAKGVEIGTLLRMSEVICSTIDGVAMDRIATLSGPSHAEEVARGVPTSVVAASVSNDFAVKIQELFNNITFRVYRSTDLIGVELGGSLKNVIAIGSGITQGLGFGDNTTGALLTRGLAEITRMGVKAGADPLTFAGLSGIGDLVTTCISRHSRNRYVGDRIGKGEKLTDILNSMVMVAEGVDTCRSANAMADKFDVDMPITRQVYKVLFEDKPPARALTDLMGRTLKEEIWS
ncbi:MAG: glycerol-3-phosphate dehydrogenase [candidate division Zixibacteria bacterium HGW-Zixibacteria-1]|nr:MAG: glycerol-3-phosphate dehydrogenase [candidate division Zixibacteria bacterium HGW-Zixibacteria-1]